MSSPRPSQSRSADGPDRNRKAEHIQLALDRRMQLRESFFDGYAFEHRALPEIDFAEIDLAVPFLGATLSAPLLISCMTGGAEEATAINRRLAQAAEETRIAVGVGSQRAALEDPTWAEGFRIRPFAPSVPILANLGAVQLNYGVGLQECRRAVDMVEADALVFHLNPLQEAIQPEGQRDFRGLLAKMGRIAAGLQVPVIAKEIGCGISGDVARDLVRQGIRIVDTAGVGGTTWARIEAERASTPELGELFADWGIPTPVVLEQLREVPELTVIASGGIRNGVDIAKALALGANLAGMAYPFLQAARESKEKVIEIIQRTVHELKICMFCVGARTIPDLQAARLSRREPGTRRAR